MGMVMGMGIAMGFTKLKASIDTEIGYHGSRIASADGGVGWLIYLQQGGRGMLAFHLVSQTQILLSMATYRSLLR